MRFKALLASAAAVFVLLSGCAQLPHQIGEQERVLPATSERLLERDEDLARVRPALPAAVPDVPAVRSSSGEVEVDHGSRTDSSPIDREE